MDSITVRVRWNSTQPVPKPSNQVVVQRTPADEVVVTFGYVAVPIILGTNEQKQALAAQIVESGGVEVQSIARVAVTLKTAQQLLRALTEQIAAKFPED